MLLGREASSFLIQKHLLNSLVDSKHNLPVLYINKPMSFHEICLLSSGPLCFLDCFFGLIPSERNVLIFRMLDSTFSLMIALPDQERPIMDTQNSVMRIYFDGVDAVDLLIFTSKQLHLDSLNTVTSPSTENFLWGIFRDKNHCRADMYDNGTTVDMEVDMAGGKMVGTVDVVVRKDSSTRSGTELLKGLQGPWHPLTF